MLQPDPVHVGVGVSEENAEAERSQTSSPVPIQRITVIGKFLKNTWCHKKSEQFTIGVWNAQSVRNKTKTPSEYVLEHNFAAFLLTETWMSISDHVVIGELCPKGSAFINAPRGDNHGGLGVLYKQPLTFHIIPTHVNFRTFEHIISDSKRKTYYALVYRIPPSPINTIKTAQFYLEFEAFLISINSLSGTVIQLHITLEDSFQPPLCWCHRTHHWNLHDLLINIIFARQQYYIDMDAKKNQRQSLMTSGSTSNVTMVTDRLILYAPVLLCCQNLWFAMHGMSWTDGGSWATRGTLQGYVSVTSATILEGEVQGKITCGHPKATWVDSIKHWSGLNINKSVQEAQNRNYWWCITTLADCVLI